VLLLAAPFLRLQLRVRARSLAVSAITGIVAASCQGQVGGVLLDGSSGVAGIGSGGTAGNSGVAGIGSGGVAGIGSGGIAGIGSGMAGASGSGGSDDGGIDDSGSAVTFTALYASLFGTSLCAGTLCHNPGIQKGTDLSSQANAYRSLQFEIVPGDSAGSALYRLLMDGTMPPDPPKVTATQLAMVRAWIDAGALNN
jgi:hypothetical protein